MRIVVTGASGFIGGAIARRLVRDGHHVIGITSKPQHQRKLAEQGMRPQLASLHEPTPLQQACTGAGAVVHCAGKGGTHGRTETFFRANADGTQAIVEAAAATGVTQFIHISTLRVFGMHPISPADESSPMVRSGHPYADSKIEAERRLLRHQGGPRILVLRPGSVYGPGDRLLMPALLDALRHRRVRLAGAGDNRLDPLYRDDLAAMVAALLSRTLPHRSSLNLTPSQPVSARALTDTLCALTNLPKPRQLPPRTAKLARSSRGRYTHMPAVLYDLLTLDRHFSRRRMKQLLGEALSETTPLATGLAATLRALDALPPREAL